MELTIRSYLLALTIKACETYQFPFQTYPKAI